MPCELILALWKQNMQRAHCRHRRVLTEPPAFVPVPFRRHRVKQRLQPARWLSGEWPDSRAAAAVIAFGLGNLFSRGASGALSAWRWSLRDQEWATIINSPALGFYIAAWSLFHALEYLVTAIYNPQKVTVDSYLLNNGRQYHVAHGFAVAEYLVTCRIYPLAYAQAKTSLAPLGIVMVLAAQAFRSLAMATAAANFSHIIATKKRDEHVLVTNGIYAWTRHPSYVGFTYWALGTQLVLGNAAAFVGFAIVLLRYFHLRIQAEERYLVHFFGQEYEEYRRRVPTRLPFIA